MTLPFRSPRRHLGPLLLTLALASACDDQEAIFPSPSGGGSAGTSTTGPGGAPGSSGAGQGGSAGLGGAGGGQAGAAPAGGGGLGGEAGAAGVSGSSGQSGVAGAAGGGNAAGEGGEGGSAGASGQGGAAGSAGSAGAGGQAGATQTTLTITKGASTFPLSQAYFGLTRLKDGSFEIYVEVYEGAAPGCPVQDSPSPDRTLILAGLLPATTTPQTKADGVSATVLDFEGSVTDLPVLKSTMASITTVAENLCTECYGQPDPGGRFYTFTMTSTFDDGVSIAGTGHAAHCDSLDD